MATYAQFKHVELYKIGHGKNRVPNAPKSSIGEIFNGDSPDGGKPRNGTASSRPRAVRDCPNCPRDTHSRLFGQSAQSHSVAPLVTDTIRSNIKFGEMNGSAKVVENGTGNGSAASTPSRGDRDIAQNSSFAPPRRNPVTGDGVTVPPLRRRHPAANLRGADPDCSFLPDPDPFEPQPTHRYFTREWPPRPADYYVESTTKPSLSILQTPYSLLGLKSDDPEKSHPVIDPNSLSPQLVLDRHWPPFPAQHYLEPSEHKIPHYPLPPYAFVGLTSKLGDRPDTDYNKYNPIPSLDGPIDPYLIANCDPPPTLFKYERDAPIPDVTPLETPATRGPHTLTGFPPIFPKHVPGYLFSLDRHAEDFKPKTYFVDYVRQRAMEGNPITGDGYRSAYDGAYSVSRGSFSSRVPPGGYSNGLW